MRHKCRDLVISLIGLASVDELLIRIIGQLFRTCLVYKGNELGMFISMFTCNLLVRNEDQACNLRFIVFWGIFDHVIRVFVWKHVGDDPVGCIVDGARLILTICYEVFVFVCIAECSVDCHIVFLLQRTYIEIINPVGNDEK